MTSGRATREARRLKMEQERARVARQQATRRATKIGFGVVVLVVAIMAGFVFWQDSRRDQQAQDAAAATPANLGDDNSVVVGEDSAPVTVAIYEDFQCPTCAKFESANREQLADWVADGDVQIQYRPVAFLDSYSTDNYSTRATNAAGAVVNADPDAFQDFHDLLFENQPDEGGAGLTDDELISYAVEAGVSEDDVRDAVENQTYADWAAQITEDASTAEVAHTPTVLVDGTALDEVTKKALKSAVEAALADADTSDATGTTDATATSGS